MSFSQTSPNSTKSNSVKPTLSEKDKADTFEEFKRRLGPLLTPPEKLNVWQWAEKFRHIARGVSAKTLDGPKLYRSADAPHQRKPQESVTDPTVQVTVLVMASQIGGKTEIFNNVSGYHIHHRPRSQVIMYPTLEATEKYSKKKFTPMVEATPELSKLLRGNRMRDTGNTILSKEFSGVSVYFVGANSPPSLRGASGAVLLGDEIDSNEEEAGQEGDPVELLFRRGESFPNCVKMLASTPTILGASAIWSWFLMSDQQYWFVPCAKCGKYQLLKWFQVQWPKDSKGGHEPEKAFLVCSVCSASLSDKHRVEMYFNGEWRPTAPFKGIAGFHLNGIYAPWPHQKGYSSRLHQMASDFLRAKKGGPRKLKVWTNTFLAEPFEEESVKVEAAPIMKRAEKYTPQTLPDEVLIVVCGIDIQKGLRKHTQVEIVGVGLEDETWGIETFSIQGDPEGNEVWFEEGGIADVISKRIYKTVSGRLLSILATVIDMRYKPNRVRNFIRTSGLPVGSQGRPGIFPMYGISSGRQERIVTTSYNKQGRMRTYALDRKRANDILFARLQVPEPGPRYMHFPIGKGYNEEYFNQLTAEVLKTRFKHGFAEQFYEKVGERNEALDIRGMLIGLMEPEMLNPNLTAIAKRLPPPGVMPTTPRDYTINPTPDPNSPAQPTPPPAPRPPQRMKIRVGNWGKGY